MSTMHEDLDQIAVERELLQEVCALVRSWQGRPPAAALDVVLSGSGRPLARCASTAHRRTHSRGPGPGSGPARRAR